MGVRVNDPRLFPLDHHRGFARSGRAATLWGRPGLRQQGASTKPQPAQAVCVTQKLTHVCSLKARIISKDHGLVCLLVFAPGANFGNAQEKTKQKGL